MTVDPLDPLTKSSIDATPYAFRDYHSLDTLLSQIEGQAHQTPGIETNLALTLGFNYILPTILNNNQSLFVASYLAGLLINYDPPPGMGYTLIDDPNSPFLYSIGLPELPDVAGWRLNYLQGDVWSSDFLLASLDEFVFGADVNGVRFFPIDADGNDTFNSSPFTFGLKFVADGTVTSLLTVDLGPERVPEPSSIALFTLGSLVLLGVIREESL